MAHEHDVYNADLYFVIDPTTREITNNSGKVRIMQNDHQSERFTFEIPRYVDSHDMSTCNRVEIHYLNVGSTSTNAGIYEVGDLQISADSSSAVTCAWLLTNNATKLAGTLNFVLRFACLTDGVVDYAWHTAVYSGISVVSSINNTETIVEEYADILAEWETRIIKLEEIVGSYGLSDLSIYATTEYVEANYVSAESLQTVTDAILSQAKASGEFDGEDGSDGVSVTHTWDGTTLSVTSASGTSSADLKGEKGDTGADGYTPVKGTDYYTEVDKEEMVELVIAAPPDASEVSY